MTSMLKTGVLICVCIIAVWPGQMACDDDRSDGGSDGDSDGDSDSDSDSDSDGDADDQCAGYREAYPEGPYGTAVGSILADFPGMVDGTGASHSLEELYLDTSIVAIVIANAFDT